MIVTLVTFHLERAWTREQAIAMYRSTAPKYLDKPGLIQKHYVLHDGGMKTGAVYLWTDRASAEACFGEAWKRMVSEKYGAIPDVVYMDSPVTVDNAAGAIVEDDGS